MRQIPLSLTLPSEQDIKAFFVTGANQLAYNWIEAWPDWPAPYQAVNIYGPKGCGKTHLGQLFSKKAHVKSLDQLRAFHRDDFTDYDAILLDGVANDNSWDEESLFHLINYLAETQKSALITSHEPLSQMPWRLPDLKSRMRAIASQNVEMPDDDLLLALLEDYFTRRQCQVAEPALRYIVARLERSYEAVANIVQAIDRLSLAQKRAITTALIKPLFEQGETS